MNLALGLIILLHCLVFSLCDVTGSRDPRIFSFFRNLIFSRVPPALTSSYKQKFGDIEKDPYNQNQLLNNNAILNTGSVSRPIMVTRPPGQHLGHGIIQSENGESSAVGGIESLNSLFVKLIGEDTSPSSIVSNIINLGSGSMGNLLNRINKFDSLKCIPRLLCQTIAQRGFDSQKNSTTTTTKTIKIQGIETALEQFMAFLDLVKLKDWSLYPYIRGAYEGSQVKRLDECGEKFQSCPFSDQQLVYYFNNYNGGFFQSLGSDS